MITEREVIDTLAQPASDSVDWSSLSTRSWLTPIMASDWVRLAFLGPASGSQLPAVRTHTNGSALSSILDVIPEFLPLCKFINSNRPDNKTIDPIFHFSLALLLTSALLPPLIPDNIPLLAGIISSNTLFGTWGIALSWNRTSWSLDTAPLVDQKSILERFEMLPPTPPRPVKGVWSASRTWYGLLPRELPPAWEEAMEHLSSSARAKAKLCLSQTIAAGQKLSWEISADLIHQFLVRAKRMATAKAKGKKPPRWRPLFTKVAAHKASFPPSQRTESYAASFLAKGTAITSAAFAGEAASLGIPTALRADTWLRVLQMRVRLGKKGIASLVDNTPLADRGTPQPPPVGSFWVPEAAPSHSSPRVRQGPSPDPVPDIVHPEPPVPEPQRGKTREGVLFDGRVP